MRHRDMMDALTIAVIEHIGELGYIVHVGERSVVAIDETTGERFAVRAGGAKGAKSANRRSTRTG